MPNRISQLLRVAQRVRPDGDLLRAHLAGDPAAMDELVRRYIGLARRASAEVCPPAADDVAQATLTLLARKAAAIAGRESAAGWVFETARRLALKARTTAARRAAREGRAKPPQPPVDPLDALTLREVRAAVAEELARLPDTMRLPLVLCYWDGLTRPAAAARLGCSVSTLKRRLDSGRDRLAARLKRRGFTGPAILAALTAVEAGADAAAPTPGAAAVVRWKLLSAIVFAASAAVVGIGIGVSAPVAGQPAKRNAPPAAGAKQPAPAVDRYGDPLPDGAVARLGTVRFRHGGQLQSVAYSPDGQIIASGGFGRIMLWEAATGKPIGPLVRTVQLAPAEGKPAETQVQHGQTFSLAFTPDGKRLLSGGSPEAGHRSGMYVFWDVAARKLDVDTLVTDAAGTQWIRAVAIAPNGKTAAFGTDSGKLYLLDTKTQGILATHQTTGVAGLSFAHDCTALAVATYQRVMLLDPTNLRVTQILETGGRARQVTFAPDGKSLWIGCDGGDSFGKDKEKPGTISRWDLATRTAVQTFTTSPGMLLSLALSKDGKSLASGGVSVGPFLWDTATGKAIDLDALGQRVRPWVQGLAFAPDGKTLAVADSNGRVRVWDAATRKELHCLDEHDCSFLKVALSPDRKTAATAGGDGTVRIWDLVSSRAVRTWKADDARSVFTVAFAPDGRSLLTSGSNGTVRLWDVATGKEVRRFRDEKSLAKSALSPDGKLVAASGKDGKTITLFETDTGRPVREPAGHVSFLMWLTFSPDGRRLISAADMHSDNNQIFDDRSVRVWDVATGRQIHKFNAGRPHSGAAISPDGRVVAAAGSLTDEGKGLMRFWDVVAGKEIEDHRIEKIARVAFSPDRRYMAAANNDIRIVEVASGRLVQTFQPGAGATIDLTFTPDGRRLLSAHDDGTCMIWDVTPRPLDIADRAKLWDELAADNAAAARRAAATLAADPAATVTMLGDRLKPVPTPASRRTTAALIADLDSPMFRVREAASRELATRVDADGAELTTALANSTSAETRRRLSETLRSAPGPWPTLTAEDLRRVRAVEVLETIATPDAKKLLQALANGDPHALLTREARAASARLGR